MVASLLISVINLSRLVVILLCKDHEEIVEVIAREMIEGTTEEDYIDKINIFLCLYKMKL